jgi:chemotaxis protein MotB
MAKEQKDEPIIIKKIIKKGGHGGHHGGAWKVAYADFVTAMMCLFLLLWLINVDPSSKAAISSYFKQPTQTGPLQGNVFIFGGAKKPTDPGKFEGGSSFFEYQKLMLTGQNKEEMKKAIQNELQKELEMSADQELLDKVEFNLLEDGILIEIKDSKGIETFNAGSATLTEDAKKIIDKLAQVLKNKMSLLVIAGHTDSKEFGFGNYDNWNLSTDRAIAVKSRLTYAGVNSTRFARVEGYADSQLKYPGVPLSPGNRRITIKMIQQGEEENLKPKYLDSEAELGSQIKEERLEESDLKTEGQFKAEEYITKSQGKSNKLPTLEELRRKKAREAFRKANPAGSQSAEGGHGGGHEAAPAEPAPAKEAGGHGGGH